MNDENAIVRERQLAIRRELDRRGIALKAVALDAQMPYSTVLSYFPADGTPQIMSVASLFRLCNAIPDDLLSLLLPENRHIIKAPAGVDHDEFEAGCALFLDVKRRAHHKDSPAGEKISECENEALNVVRLPLEGKVA